MIKLQVGESIDMLVYVRSFPFEVSDVKICCIERQKEIDACKSDKAKLEKYYAWKLLEIALKDYMNKDTSEIKFQKRKNKWTCTDCHFSLSHSKNLVAVAVSDKAVGIDIESYCGDRFNKEISKRILTDCEFEHYSNLSDLEKKQFCNIAWSQKEALFKMQDKDVALSQIETLGASVFTKTIALSSGDEFFLSVAGDCDNVEYNLSGLNFK